MNINNIHEYVMKMKTNLAFINMIFISQYLKNHKIHKRKLTQEVLGGNGNDIEK